MYGLKNAAIPWYKDVVSIVQDLGGLKSRLDPTVFYWRDERGVKGVMSLHVDDFFYEVIWNLKRRSLED